MNRRQKRWLRRHTNRKNYLLNRRNWRRVGPPVVMEDPTDEHVKALLMEWISPRAILEQVAQKVAQEVSYRKYDGFVDNAGGLLAKLSGEARLDTLPVADLWSHLLHGVVVNNPQSALRITSD